MKKKDKTNKEDLIEKLADLEHQQWAHWTDYFVRNSNSENIQRWKLQSKTPYSNLSEKDKEKDRIWARKILELIKFRNLKGREDIFFEQYKLYADTAEKVSDRRQNANNFFLTLNSLLLTFTGYLTTLSFAFWNILMAVAGLSISLLWFLTIASFRNLNKSKFNLICDMERNLPINIFGEEWKQLGEGRDWKKYIKISKVEQGIPVIFFIIYLLMIILRIPLFR